MPQNNHAFFKDMVLSIQILTMLGLRDSLILKTGTKTLKQQQYIFPDEWYHTVVFNPVH